VREVEIIIEAISLIATLLRLFSVEGGVLLTALSFSFVLALPRPG
jgi:hypothetical protein